jgi:dihydroorotate dehydrogenase
VDDYLICLDKVYAHASYVTVNVSSPNTPGLRSLQFGDSLKQLLADLATRRAELALRHGKHVPLAIKIAPDMSDEETALVAQALIETGMDAVIATNTTLSRVGVEGMEHGDEAGGLSGAPVRDKSTHTVKVLAAELGGACRSSRRAASPKASMRPRRSPRVRAWCRFTRASSIKARR